LLLRVSEVSSNGNKHLATRANLVGTVFE
jgi:hypothetical protein